MKPSLRDSERNVSSMINRMHKTLISHLMTQMKEACSLENQQGVKSRLTKIASLKILKRRYQTKALIQTYNKNISIASR